MGETMRSVDMGELLLRFRRMMRTAKPHAVVNIAYSRFAFITSQPKLLLVQLNGVSDLAEHYGAEFHVVQRTDVIVVFPEDRMRHVPEFMDRVLACIMPDRQEQDREGEEVATVYRVPEQYAELRLRLDHYDKLVQAEQPPAPAVAAALPLEGPLTPALVGEIQSLILDLDVRRYVRSQLVYQNSQPGRKEAVYREYFVSIDELRRALFPKVEIGDTGLFHEICRTLDLRMLEAMGQELHRLPSGRVGLNICLDTVHTGFFDGFLRRLQGRGLPMPVLEIGVQAFLSNPGKAERATARLRKLGCGVVLDGISLDLVQYLWFDRFDVDFVKFYAHREHFARLGDAGDLDRLRRISRKAIFCHCDHPTAISIGHALGIDKYQGWLLDEDAKPAALVATA